MKPKNKETVFSVTKKILIKLNALTDIPSGKAILAKLRHSVGKPLGEATDIWPILFDNLPEEFLGSDRSASDEELVIMTALQFYAIHQQGNKVSIFNDEEKYKNIGYSLRQLHIGERQISVDRRFNAMITASTFDELVYHLRHFIKLLKSKTSDTRVNYAKLADDLYWFLKGYRENVRLAWAREYYKNDYKGDEV